MRWRVEGSHRSGVKIDPFIIDAPSQEEAMQDAQSRGIEVRSVVAMAMGSEATKAKAEELSQTEEPRVVRSAGYEYKMVQIPPVVLSKKDGNQSQAAQHLETTVNRFARQGWEFYRIDSIGIKSDPGCIGAILGLRSRIRSYHVVTFRRPLT